MEPEFWYICPIWFIPSSVLWFSLNHFCDKYCFAERFSKRFGWPINLVKKILGWITGGISLVFILIIVIVISLLIGFDLLNWQWYNKN